MAPLDKVVTGSPNPSGGHGVSKNAALLFTETFLLVFYCVKDRTNIKKTSVLSRDIESSVNLSPKR